MPFRRQNRQQLSDRPPSSSSPFNPCSPYLDSWAFEVSFTSYTCSQRAITIIYNIPFLPPSNAANLGNNLPGTMRSLRQIVSSGSSTCFALFCAVFPLALLKTCRDLSKLLIITPAQYAL